MSNISKAAFNERKKLTATYWNNIAVGVMITGYIAPVFSITLVQDLESSVFYALVKNQMTFEQWAKLISVVGVAVISLFLSLYLHRNARKILSNIVD